MDEYYDKITGNPKYALHGMCNPLMICRASRSVALNNLALYHELMEENPEALNCLKDAVIE